MTNRRSFPAILRGLVLDICVGLWTWVSSSTTALPDTWRHMGQRHCAGPKTVVVAALVGQLVSLLRPPTTLYLYELDDNLVAVPI